MPGPMDMLDETTTCAVADVLSRRGIRGAMAGRIRALNTHRLAGPALTVERVPVGSAKARPNGEFLEVLDTIAAGTVLVFNGFHEHEVALWGGLLAAAGARRKIGGVVADGAVRDAGEIAAMKQACFCTGTVAAAQIGVLTLGAIGARLSCGDVLVNAGDFVFGDADGVVVVPSGILEEVIREAVEVERLDQEAARRILAGAGLRETMRALGRA